MASFHDVLFPTAVSFGATGGPERAVEIVRLTSGREKRNARTAHARRRYDAGTGLRSADDLQEIMDFFEARRGPLCGFRFRDPFDAKSCRMGLTPTPLDQVLGEGDGETAAFRLVKVHGQGADAYRRPITRPVDGSVRVAVDGVEAAAQDFSVDHATGVVTFEAGAIPPPGAVVTAGFEFHVPARFDTEAITVSLAAFKAGQIPTIPIIELPPEEA
ncbi:MAG: DUF2460 domain-containing protein [Rhizobiaceae bacterium]|nr:DUF2460 domain-containing protein [Rhizobiaceae bacterium]MCV0405477.1 DUF2460 domain-containing protein [Rhizobiaceae bacterium]